ncbi:MAG TPA: amino acid racemase [Thermoanaerobaculia bacterium]|jgi:aspartate racemase|nr:amino acid racemase [Thermoanaerobaculia bacterium]
MPLHIGIVACSAEGAALCYRTICDEGPALMGKHRHPEVSMHTHSLGQYMDFIHRDDWQGVADLMLSSAEKLESIGADFLICPDNTLHRSFARVAERSPLPWLHIVEEVAAETKRRGFTRVGITGTVYTMEGPVYPEVLERNEIDYRVPSPSDRAKIDRIIFEELVNGIFKSESLAVFRAVIERMKAEECDAVVLGCTEIPLIVTPENSPLPVLDSTRLLARAALKKALGAAESAGSRVP